MRAFKLMLSVTVVLSGTALVMAQARPVRPGAGGPMGPMGAGPGGGFNSKVLTPRKLQNRSLEDKDKKKYDSLTAAMTKHASAARSSTPNPAQDTMNAFRLGATQLRYGQEADAAESFGKAWESLAGLMKDPKSAAAGIGQARGHLRELQSLATKDPELALTYMSDLDEKHKAAYDAIQNAKTKPQLANPIIAVWVTLAQIGPIDRLTMPKAARWLLMAPQMAMADRVLSEQQRSTYDGEVAKVNIDINAAMRRLAERQLAAANRPGAAPPPPLRPGENAPETADPLTLRAITALEPKRGAIARFTEAEVHLRFGQFRQGELASINGWKELLEVYHTHPGSVGPFDTQTHFESLAQLAGENPVQAMLLLDHLDMPYRAMCQVDRAFALQIAEEWLRIGKGMPLNSALLSRTLFWVSAASKLGKEQENRYKAVAEDLQKQLAEARKTEGIEDDDDDDDKAEHERGHKKTGGKEDKEDDDKPGEKEDKEDNDKDEKNERHVGGKKIPLPPSVNKREVPAK